MENYWANFKSFSRIQDSLRTLELSDCVLRIPFIRRGRPIECWLHTYQACAKATWRLGLRLFWSHAITIKIYLQIIFICCVSRLFIIFPDYISIFQVWKITGQISRVFQEFKTLYERWSYQIAFYAFHSFVVDVQSNAGYIRTKHAQKQPED